MDVSEVRRRVREAITKAKSGAQERRARVDAATREYETFLTARAVPTFHAVASALTGEGLRFTVSTPAGSVRLSPAGAAEDYIELSLHRTGDTPQVIGRSSRGRGRRLVTSERPVKDGADVASLSEEDVITYLMEELPPFVAK
jgi:hypothetical protein